MRFQSDKSWFVTLVLWGAVIFMIFAGMLAVQQGGPEQWMPIILVLVALMIIWMWFATYYEIEGKRLYYRSGPVNGSIDINAIRKIESGKTQFSGLKPALASNGCVVHYNKYDEIYLSPKDKDGFFAELLKVNPAIEVVEKK